MRIFIVLTLVTSANVHATESTPALIQHRVSHLVGMVEPELLLVGPVAPALTTELEVMRDWIRLHPEHLTHFEGLLARYLAEVTEMHRLQSDWADRDTIMAQINQYQRTWDEMRALPTDPPWNTLSWPRVFAERIAEMEVRVAERLGVDVARAFQLTEHALPMSSGFLGADAMIREVAAGYDQHGPPLYSDANLEVLFEEARTVSEIFASTLRHANVEEPARLPIREIITRLANASPTFERRPDVARGRLEELNVRFSGLPESARRTVVLEEIAHCMSELEVAPEPG